MDQPADIVSDRYDQRLYALLSGNGLLRLSMAASSSSALAGFYLADLARQGVPIGAGIVGVINGVLDVAVLLGALPFGLLVDRRTPRFVLLLGVALGAIATQLFGITALIPVFILSRILEGLAFAAVSPSVLTHLTNITVGNPLRRGRVMSFFELSAFIGLALGTALSGPLWEWLGTWGFSVMAIGYIAAGFLFVWGTSGRRPQFNQVRAAPPALGQLKEAWQDPEVRRLAPAWLAANAIIGLWTAHLVFQLSGPPLEGQYLVGRFTPTQVSTLAFFYALLIGLGVAMWGKLLGRFTRPRALMIALYGLMSTNVIFYLLNHSGGWAAAWRWGMVGIYGVFIMVQAGFTPAALAYLADIAARRDDKGVTMGVYTVLFSLGNIFGAVVGAALAAWLAIDGLVIGSVALSIVAYFALRTLGNDKKG